MAWVSPSEQKIREAVKRGLCQPHWIDKLGLIHASVDDLTTDVVNEVLKVLDGEVTHGAVGRRA